MAMKNQGATQSEEYANVILSNNSISVPEHTVKIKLKKSWANLKF